MDHKENRNPLLIPTSKESVRLRGCPKCKKENYSGRNIQGIITFTCHECRNQWHGGIGQEVQDPTIPLPAQDPLHRPTVDFLRNKHGEAVEVNRRPNPVQEFRKGLPVPEGED